MEGRPLTEEDIPQLAALINKLTGYEKHMDI
jgi:hypothetical protein